MRCACRTQQGQRVLCQYPCTSRHAGAHLHFLQAQCGSDQRACEVAAAAAQGGDGARLHVLRAGGAASGKVAAGCTSRVSSLRTPTPHTFSNPITPLPSAPSRHSGGPSLPTPSLPARPREGPTCLQAAPQEAGDDGQPALLAGLEG